MSTNNAGSFLRSLQSALVQSLTADQKASVVHLEGTENIHEIRTIISRADAERLLLVVPKKHPAFQKLVHLRMVARHANDVGVGLALVTKDHVTRGLAGEARLSTFWSVAVGQNARWWRDGKDPARRFNPDMSGARTAPERVRRGTPAAWKAPATSSWADGVMLAGLVFGVIIVLSAAGFLLVPSAQVTLVPNQVPLEVVVPVTIDITAPRADSIERLVPAETIEVPVQGTLEVLTSGRTDAPSAPARGSVFFVNVTGQEANVPEGTIVSTSGGTPVRFRTLRSVSIREEIGARVTVPVEALNPGPVGNVGPLQINVVEGPAASTVRVFNESALEGGTVQQRPVVTTADKEQLRNQLHQRLLQEGRVVIEQTLGEGTSEANVERFLVPGSVDMDVTAETYNGSIGEQLDILRLDLRARVSGIVVKRDDLVRVVRPALREQVPDGYEMIGDGLSLFPSEVQVGENGQPVMEVRVQGKASAVLSGNDIRELTRGRPVEEARDALVERFPLAVGPSITVTPDWWDRMPYVTPRIFVRVGVVQPEDNTSSSFGTETP